MNAFLMLIRDVKVSPKSPLSSPLKSGELLCFKEVSPLFKGGGEHSERGIFEQSKNFYIGLLITFLLMSSCQLSYQIKANNFPKKIATDSALKTSDGHTLKLSELYHNKRASVLIFWQRHCPCVKRYQDRIERLANNYRPSGIDFFYLSSNQNETFAEALSEFNKRSTSLPLLRDEGGKLAKTFLAKGTPTAAVISNSGELIYFGWIDNERLEGEQGRIAYLENSLKNIVNGQPVTTPTSPMFGCSIK